MSEIWKPVPGFERYEVSSLGRIRSLWNRKGTKEIHILKIKALNREGYHQVGLSKNGSKEFITQRVHRLILMAFKGPCPKGMESIHRDGDKTNNRYDNLEWGTRSKNQKMWKALNSEISKYKPRLTKNEVAQIKRLYHVNHYTQSQIADCFNIHHTRVSKIVNNILWPNIRMAKQNDRLPLVYKKTRLYHLAKEAEITPSYLSMILNGKSGPSWITAKQLARATDTKADQWMDGTPSERKAMAFKFLGGKK